MSDDRTTTIEPERYELDALPAYAFELQRRTFFKLVGGGLAVLIAAPVSLPAQESGRRVGLPEAPRDLEAWLHIGEDGAVTVYTGKAEVGQNIRTSLTQA